jgi:hypothetical protein
MPFSNVSNFKVSDFSDIIKAIDVLLILEKGFYDE